MHFKGKLNKQKRKHNGTIFQSVLIVFAEHYKHWTTFDETTAPQIWLVFSEAHCVA